MAKVTFDYSKAESFIGDDEVDKHEGNCRKRKESIS